MERTRIEGVGGSLGESTNKGLSFVRLTPRSSLAMRVQFLLLHEELLTLEKGGQNLEKKGY